MTKATKIVASDEAWESGALGTDEGHAKLSPDRIDEKLDQALQLQPISIRLQKSLIEDFKMIAELNGLGYQTLMRQVLARFADCEKKNIMREMIADARKSESELEEPKEPSRKVA